MSYGKTWNHGANLASRHRWALVGEILELIDQLEAVKFSLQQERIKGLDILSKLTTTRSLFNKDKRFPEDDIYIDLQSGDWPSKFEQVRTSLNYKPPENSFVGGNKADEKHQQPHPKQQNHSTTNNFNNNDPSIMIDLSEREKFEKALKAYYTGLQSMENQIGQGTGLFDTEHFEKHQYLTWTS